jgi:hypothetical protein
MVREGAEGLQRENAEGGKKKREGGRSRVADILMRGGSSSRKQQQRRRHTSASTAAVAVAAFLRTISCDVWKKKKKNTPQRGDTIVWPELTHIRVKKGLKISFVLLTCGHFRCK